MENAVKFYFCTLAKYNSLESKDSTALYFVTDAKRIYKGDTLYSGSFEITSILPDVGTPDVFYYAKNTGIVSVYEEGSWVSKFLPFESTLTGSATAVPTSEAVSSVLGITATDVAASGAILTKTNGKIRLNENYNPGVNLKFNGKEVGSGVTTLNFAGTTTITVDDNNVAKVQIGENMNSSVWAIKDGKQGDGTVQNEPSRTSVIIPNADGASFNVGDWTAGNAQTVGSKSSSFTIQSKEYIHMDEGVNTWEIKVYDGSGTVVVKANVNDTVAYNDPVNVTSATVTASAISYEIGSAGITHSILSGALEDNYPSAVGGRAQVKFTFNLASIPELENGGRYKIEINGCGGTWTSNEIFYVKEATPAISDVTLALNEGSTSTKTVSGVKYITAATFTTNVTGITNLNNQAASTKKLSSSSSQLTGEDSDIQSNELTNYTTAWNNECSYTKADLSLATSQNLSGTAISISFTPYNFYATGSAKTSNSVTGLNINTYPATDSTDSEENFLSENKRLKTDLTTWNSTDTLGSEDLQVIPGVGLVYPSIDYSAIANPENNPDYSSLTGERFFVRKMVSGSGTKFGGTLTLAGLGNNWSNITTALLSIDGGSSWYNLKADRGGADPTGILNSYTSSSGVLSFNFPGTDSLANATTGVIVKFGWSNKSVKITKITLSM